MSKIRSASFPPKASLRDDLAVAGLFGMRRVHHHLDTLQVGISSEQS
ncbi:MAG: hypothetical protein HYR76_04800 [Ignavibacteria bacterium]|nr:hypothetical protein [Ignavibacteria bacterium]